MDIFILHKKGPGKRTHTHKKPWTIRYIIAKTWLKCCQVRFLRWCKNTLVPGRWRGRSRWSRQLPRREFQLYCTWIFVLDNNWQSHNWKLFPYWFLDLSSYVTHCSFFVRIIFFLICDNYSISVTPCPNVENTVKWELAFL